MKKIIKEYREQINNNLIPHMQQKLQFETLPTINFVEDEQNAKDMFGKTAYYNPSSREITVFVTNRHPKDIMRSVAHEVIHHAQNCRGEFDNSFNLGEEGYAQKDSHLRNMELEAYSEGNMIFRDWEDNYKLSISTRNKITMTNESKIRTLIRSMIKEMFGGDDMQSAEMVSNEPIEHYQGDGCMENDPTHIEALKLKHHNLQGYEADEVPEEDPIPLNEWRNKELNSLLMTRFGIVSPQVLGEMTSKQKELAAKYPPKDKITRGDIIAAATEDDKKNKLSGKKTKKLSKKRGK